MKRVLAFVVSIAIMAIIFSRIDVSQFAVYMGDINWWMLGVGVLFFVPQVWISAYRWQIMTEEKVKITLWQSTELILVANALNILLPSRVGDLSKAYFMKKKGHLELKRGMNIVIFEKYIDLAALGVVILVGIVTVFKLDEASFFGLCFAAAVLGTFPLLYFVRIDKLLKHSIFEKNKILAKIKHFLEDTQDYLFQVKNNPGKLIYIVLVSVFLWFLHITQFYVIFKALKSGVGLFTVYRLVPLAILIGLLPITIAGVGTRDSAMLYFFSPYDDPARIVGIGLFASLRYFVPGLLGLPFLNKAIVELPDTKDENMKTASNE